MDTPEKQPDKGKQAPLSDSLKPKSLPKPDAPRKLPPSRMEPGAGRTTVLRPEKQKKKSEDKKGGCGCLALILVAVLCVAGITVGLAAWMVHPFNAAGFAQNRSIILDIVESPSEPTLFIASSVAVAAPLTGVEIGVIGADVKLSGVYAEKVYVRGISVHCEPGTVFEKDLEVFAKSFTNEGTIRGNLTGRVAEQR